MYKILYLLRYLFNSRKVKKFITIILLIIAVMSFFELKFSRVEASTTISDSTYYDGVQATYADYEALQNDFVTRILYIIKLNNYTLTPSMQYWLNRLSNGGYTIMFYYGDALGTYYQNTYPSASQKNIIEVICMDASQVTSNINNFDWGLNGVQGVRGYLCATSYYELKINRGSPTYTTLNANTARHYLPSYLIDYKSPALVNLLNEWNQGTLIQNTDNLITAIENQTSTIEEQRATDYKYYK